MRTTLVFAALLCASACRSTADPVLALEPAKKVLARVDGEPISAAAYQAWLADTFGAKQRQEYIGIWLLEREASRRAITVSREQIDAALAKLWESWIKERLNGDPAALDAELERQGHDRESYARWYYWEKRRELLAKALIHDERVVSEENLLRRFEQIYGPGGVATKLRLLVLTRARLALELSRDPGARTLTAGELDERLMQKALDLCKRAQDGEPFEALVRAESNDLAVRKDGGVLGDAQWRLRGAALVRAAESAPIGVVMPPVPNSSGVDIFEVLERTTTRLEDVREALLQELSAAPPSLEELSALDQRLRSQARIEMD